MTQVQQHKIQQEVEMTKKQQMKYQVKKSEGMIEILLSGNITFQNYNIFRSVLTAFNGPIGSQVVLDLSNVANIDCEGLSMLIIAREVAYTRSLTLWLKGVQGKINEILAMEGFDDILPIMRA
ncbi:MAG: STAS domain-containing protein [Rhodospirillaceae bacterium]